MFPPGKPFSALRKTGRLSFRALLPRLLHPLAALSIASIASIAFAPAARAQRVSAVGDSMPVVVLDSLLDLETVVRRALAVSPAVAGARENVRTAHSEGRVAFGEYTPTVTASSGILNSDATATPTVGATPPAAYSAGIAAGIDLFTGGRRGADRACAGPPISAPPKRRTSRNVFR